MSTADTVTGTEMIEMLPGPGAGHCKRCSSPQRGSRERGYKKTAWPQATPSNYLSCAAHGAGFLRWAQTKIDTKHWQARNMQNAVAAGARILPFIRMLKLSNAKVIAVKQMAPMKANFAASDAVASPAK